MKSTLSALLPLALAGALALSPLAASAQAVSGNGVTVTSNPSTMLSGTPPIVGTITFANNGGSAVSVNQVPMTLAASGGGAASDLSSCSAYNYGSGNNDALTTGNNVLTTPIAGANTLTLDTPLTIPANSAVTLTIRCNLSSQAPASGTYAFTAGVPGTSSATNPPATSAALGASLTVFPSVPAGATNAPIAALTFSGANSNANVNVSALPVSATYGGSLGSSALTNCRWTNLGTVVAAGGTGMVNSGTSRISLPSPLMVAPGTNTTTLILSCNVSPSAPVGGTIALSFNPADITATNASTGAAVTPTTATINGVAGATSGTARVVAPSTNNTGTSSGTGTTGGTSGTGSVSVPNTGAGAGATSTLLILALSALAGLGAFAYLLRLKTASQRL